MDHLQVTTETLPTPAEEATLGGWTIDESLLERELTEEEKRALPEGLLQFREELLAARRGRQVVVEKAAIEVRPPLPGLKNYEVTALILSYSGYQDEIAKLMHSLCRLSSKYFDEEIKYTLKPHMQEWEPYIMKMIEYGFTWYDWN